MESIKKEKKNKSSEESSDKCSSSEVSLESVEAAISENVILQNLETVNNFIQKLEEIEKHINDDIRDCDKFIEFYDKSKSLLDSKDFSSDVGREEEIEKIRTILKRCSTNCVSEGIFLTGPSGQGKTYSIFYILNEIEKEKEEEKEKEKDKNSDRGKRNKRKEKEKEQTKENAKEKETEKEVEQTKYYKNIDPTHYYVSCSNCEKPYDLFVDILQQIINKDKKVILQDIKQKYNLNGLDEVKKAFISYTSKLSNLKIVIVDELDFIAVKNARVELKTKSQTKNTSEDVVKNLFECVCHSKCKIILIGIANSFDLLKDYTHMKINQIIYKPYTEKQFMNIIKHKLNSLEDELIQKIFKGVSLNIHVRQISNRSGDIRSCFDAILRVFSEKRSSLNDRKHSMLKLKEEIRVNKIFSNQERQNLLILSQKKEKTKQEKLKKIEQGSTCNKQESENNETLGNGKIHRKRSSEEKGEQRNDPMERSAKKTKTKMTSDKEEEIELTDRSTTTTTTANNSDIEDWKKEGTAYKNRKEDQLSDLMKKKQFNKYDYDDSDSFYLDNNSSFYSDDKNIVNNYESPFKKLYKNINRSEENGTPNSSTSATPMGKRNQKKPPPSEADIILNNVNVKQFVSSFGGIVDDQMKKIENKYQAVKADITNNTVMISDFKKVTDKMPLEEHTDILFKIKSLPLIQKIYLYASCNVINDEHLNSDEEEREGEGKEAENSSRNRNIEITYADIQRSYRVLCSQLSETSHIRDILEGSTIDQAIEHFEELGILTNSKKGKEKTAKASKGLSPRFATKKNTKNFSSQNKINSVYNFNLPIKVIKQTLKEISSILSTFDGSN